MDHRMWVTGVKDVHLATMASHSILIRGFLHLINSGPHPLVLLHMASPHQLLVDSLLQVPMDIPHLVLMEFLLRVLMDIPLRVLMEFPLQALMGYPVLVPINIPLLVRMAFPRLVCMAFPLQALMDFPLQVLMDFPLLAHMHFLHLDRIEFPVQDLSDSIRFDYLCLAIFSLFPSLVLPSCRVQYQYSAWRNDMKE